MAINTVKQSGTEGAGAAVAAQSGAAGKAAQANKVAAGAYAKAATAPTVSDAANVQISPKAKEMSLARKVVEETPDVREDKVAKYKDLIAKGQYKADASKIAEGMVKEALKDELAKNPDAVLQS